MKTYKYLTRTDDGAIKATGGELHAVILRGGTGGAGTAILYDNTAASGTVIMTIAAVQDTTVSMVGLGLIFAKGCYLDIGGTGASLTAVYG